VVLIEQGILISHTEVKWKWLEHAGHRYKISGLSGVFTYPQFRKQGYGKQVVAIGSDLIRAGDYDIGIFHCDPNLIPFYTQFGWTPLPRATTLVGTQESPTVVTDEVLMIEFLSNKAKARQHDFETHPIYFGDSTW
jgi:predicted acetyltransferase